jgi:hypothetical protein
MLGHESGQLLLDAAQLGIPRLPLVHQEIERHFGLVFTQLGVAIDHEPRQLRGDRLSLARRSAQKCDAEGVATGRTKVDLLLELLDGVDHAEALA